jgi:hypothetical protein
VLKMNKYQINKARAREQAQEWQANFSDNNYSWLDLANFGAYFERLAKRYGLIKEFRENGII